MSDLIERILLLKSSPAFNHVKTEDLRTVAQALEEETYFSGERVFEIGEHGDCMYIIQSGKIGISLDVVAKDTRQFIAQLAEGDCFGEMNLLDDLPRSASAHVIENATLLVLEKSRLRGLIISYPELSLGMLKSLSLRLREANLSR
ncbi:MAG: cyclic nucleotide-binding domain-containing protein [Gammaproteobacteria bacterium]|jgi:CRP-like cAMP-binding protein|nr:cyclic nucleotide-binding domain-containing protein [Gammaproteobacteria bacterium]